MSKAFICLTGCILIALAALRAGEHTQVVEKANPIRQTEDTVVGQVADTVASPVRDSIPAPVADTVTAIPKDSSALPKDSNPLPKDTSAIPARDTSAAPAPAPASQDTTTQPAQTLPTTTKVIATDTLSPEARAAIDSATKLANNPSAAQASSRPASQPASENAGASDSASKKGDGEGSNEESTSRQLDTRWFISPLLKGQFQDFGMLEKNRKGYLSDANKLPFAQRGNGSFAASAYKNITNRLSASADIGLSFGHVTNNDVLISQTQKKTFNLLNATIYYHLLPASYRLQPYVFVGINDLINDKSYLTAPAGIGAKFNAKKVMVIGQLAYGYAVNKNTANTTMYSVGIYLPLKNKKQKKQEEEDKANKDKQNANKKDTASKNGNIVNNIYITINMDSVLKAKGLLNDDGSPANRKGAGGDDGDDDGSGNGGRRKRKRGLRDDLKLDDDADLGKDDFKVDTIDGVPVIRFVVYFEFNEYSLTSKAFNSIDRVIGHLRLKNDLNIEIKGYTDNIGTESYNNFLSRRRAKMVLDYLNSRGIPSELMKAKAYGSDNPVGDNSDPNQSWLNRRAEIIVREKK